MKTSDYAIALEAKALDKIHAVLDGLPEGLPLRELADRTGLGIGYLEALLKKSKSVLKKQGRNWIADWEDCPPNFRPDQWPGAKSSKKKNVTRARACGTSAQDEIAHRPRPKALEGSDGPKKRRGPGRIRKAQAV